MENKKLAIFINSLSGGGAEKVMCRLATRLSECIDDIDVVLLRGGTQYYKLPNQVDIIDISSKKVYYTLPSIVKYFKRTRPDIVLSAGGTINVMTLVGKIISRINCKSIISIQNTKSQQKQNANEIREVALFKIMKWIYCYADGITAVSEGVKKDAAKVFNVDNDKIKKIYNPVYDESILSEMNEPIDSKWFHELEKPVILSVGRLEEQKDYTTLIKSFSMLPNEIRGSLLILGEGSKRSHLTSLGRKLGVESRICMPGFVENPYKYMYNSDLFVLSSRWEGLPTVLIEALACECPIVSTDCPSGTAEILEDGKWGTLVPVGNPSALSTAIRREINTQNVGAQKRAEEFGVEKAASDYLSIMREV